MSILPICMHVPCMPDARRGQKQALDPLEMELWIQVNMWVLGTKPSSLAASALHYPAILLVPKDTLPPGFLQTVLCHQLKHFPPPPMSPSPSFFFFFLFSLYFVSL